MQRKNAVVPVVSFPEPLVEKCLRLEAPGQEIARAMITIPATDSG